MKVDTSDGSQIMKNLVVQKQLKSYHCGMDILTDGSRVRILPAADVLISQHTDMSASRCPSREYRRTLTARTMRKHDWLRWGQRQRKNLGNHFNVLISAFPPPPL